MTHTFTEKEVVIHGEYDLGATLTIPEGGDRKYPAVVLVAGTGRGDRDGNQKGFHMNIYKQLSDFLAGLGFITLRYDKRSVGKSKGDQYTTGMVDLVDDVIANVRFLEGLLEVDHDQILLLGHSEGCILSTIANQRHPVSGMILIAGAGTAIKTAMQSQNHLIMEEIKEMKGLKGSLLRLLLSEKKVSGKQDRLFEKVLHSTDDVIRVQFSKFPAKWLREHLGYTDESILTLLKDTTCPILVVEGTKDVQTSPKGLENIRNLVQDNLSLRVVEDMNHILREFHGPKSLMNLKKDYTRLLDSPLHPGLTDAIATWHTETFGIAGLLG
ncbi:MAG TPA: alpha/beta hydrolase, partial [Clostridiaceae bacterium]|nr:alpha/beta hydrolase [Clostridiaceae bacterium]